MSSIQEYQYQVSPDLPSGPTPGQIVAGFHPPDTRVGQAITGVASDALIRIAELSTKINAADRTAELARARATYFSKMSEWTLTLPQSKLEPQEYRAEFERQANTVAGEISKGFRHADTSDAFTTWKMEQDASFVANVLKTQLLAMNDRFGAAQKKDLEVLKNDSAYLPTYIQNIAQAVESGAIDRTVGEELSQIGRNLVEVNDARTSIKGMGLTQAATWLADPKNAPGLDQNEKESLLGELQKNELLRRDDLQQKDEGFEREFADLHLKVKSTKDIYDALDKLSKTPFNDGARKYQIEGWFTSLLSSPDADPFKEDPDPYTMDSYLDIKYALNNPGMKLANDPRYGNIAGKRPTVPMVNAWLAEHATFVGNRYRAERDDLINWKSDAFSWADGEIDKFLKSDNPLKKQITWQQAADMKTNTRNYFRGQNPTQKELGDYITGQVMGQPRQITQDQGTTGAGAELGARIWNEQFPNWTWKNDPNLAKQIEGKAMVQASSIEKYFSKPTDTLATLPKETLDQMGLSGLSPVDLAKNYLITANGTALFHVNGKWLAYVPERYDPTKPAGQKYSGTEKLMQYNPGDPDPGKRWKSAAIVPEVKTIPQGNIPAQKISGMSAADITNKINALRTDRVSKMKVIASYEKEISGEIMGNPSDAYFNRENMLKDIEKIDTNILNLETALRQRKEGQ